MIKFNAVYRNKFGTNNSRYIRRINHQIPSIIYGKQFLEKELLILIEHDIIFNLQKNDIFYSSELLISLENKKFFVIVQDIQRHVYKPILLHIDFLCIK
ncbi:50S ribosomal protein L25 [Buchnera aphidicola]|uniref:50S ribosomal protein L25 n=1 Tax=Buchnera aphidicola (Cinara curvipes) TaxID=2518975 RepID=A0A451D6A8_9GAMM|nr:50S ribosomal protein L25 [Buchnera aphidicola]VFP81389.1 50S ribosomal protein L25 [Buchnera aphidicola (Cinara curvipes)]